MNKEAIPVSHKKRQNLPGTIWVSNGSGTPIKVMAYGDGWVMVRHKGCTPFVLMLKELQNEYTRV